MIHREWAVGWLVLAVAMAACTGGQEGRVHPKPPVEERILEPLPPPPPVVVEREPTPGEEGTVEVVAARPIGGVGASPQVAITFSKPIVPLGAQDEPAGEGARFSIDPPVEGVWRWMGSGAVELVPEGEIPMATTFTVEVKEGLVALDGSTLESAHRFSFTTPRIDLVGMSPHEGHRWLRTTAPRIELTFNQPVRGLEEQSWLWVDVMGERVPLSVVEVVDVAAERKARAEQYGYPYRSEGPLTKYALSPAQPLPLDEEVTLVIAPELAPEGGSLPLGKTLRRTFRTQGEMEVLGAAPCLHQGWSCAHGPIALFTRNVADVDSLKSRLTIEPEVEIDWDLVEAEAPNQWQQRTIPDAYVSLPGRYKAGETYRISVAAGLTDEEGRQAPAWSGTVKLDDRDPSLLVDSTTALLEADGDGTLPIRVVNLPVVSGTLWPLSEGEMARSLSNWKAPDHSDPRQVEVRSEAGKNVLSWVGVDVRSALEGAGNLFFLRLNGPRKYNPQVVGQITDLAVHGKLGSTSGLVWVTRLSTGESVPDAELRLYGDTGEIAWTGKTDAEGLAEVPGLVPLFPSANKWSTPFALIAAEKDGDVGVTTSRWYDGLAPYSFGLMAGWDGSAPTSLGTVFPERGIYRPGETVHLKGLARYRQMGVLRTPDEGSRLTLTVEDPHGEAILEEEVELTPYGTFSKDVRLPDDLALGTFRVRAEGDQEAGTLRYHGSFRVEAYRAPKFRVDVTAQDAVVAGDPLQATTLARYLFGAPMAEAKVRWSLTRSSSPFQPSGNEGFEFGHRVWWWDDEHPSPSREQVGAGEGTTAEAGALVTELGVADTPSDKTWTYLFEAEVTDVDRQRVAGRATTVAHPAAWYAGVRLVGAGFAETGEEAELELVAALPDGERVVGAPLSVEVKRREWRSVRKKGVGGEWFTVTEPVEEPVFSCEARSQATAVSCAFTPERAGLHVVEVSTEDEAGRTQRTRSSFYVVGGGWVSWQQGDTDRIDLVADKASYAPGDVAKVLVKSPFPNAEALVTVEREGIMRTERIRLEGSAQTLEIPIDEGMVPNVFVGVLLQRGRTSEAGLEAGDDPGRPTVKVGYTQLLVDEASKRLSVQVLPDAKVKRPGETARIDVQVQDHEGRGVEAEVTVWAVNEGVLRLTDYQVPDPVQVVHPLRGLSVRIAEPLLHLVQRRLYADKGEPSGGGGGDEAGGGIRSQFKTTALFAPEVRTDARGRASVEVELPDDLTTFRLMAVAVTKGDRFGSGSSELEVKKPLLVLPSLPRHARVHDAFEAGVVVHAPGLDVGEVKVRAEVEGLSLVGQRERTIALGAGAPVEVRFPFRAEAPGEATLRFYVEGGGERDALEQKLTISLPSAMEAVAIHGETSAMAQEAIRLPEGIRDDVGGLEVTFSSTALAGLQEGFQQLVDYPYGCLEQEASRLIPFIALRELAGRFQIPWAGGGAVLHFLGEDALEGRGSDDPDEVIARTIQSIQRLQLHSGGFGTWSSSTCPSLGGTAYAVMALSRAQALGYAVDPSVLARGQAFLASEVLGGRGQRCWWQREVDDATKVFALWALARSGAPKPSSYGDLFAKREGLPLFAKALLADTLFIGNGDRGQARTLLQEVLGWAKESPQELHFEDQQDARYAHLWSSDVRTSAIVLLTLANVSPDHPYVPKIAKYLERVRGRDGRYGSTQEAAFALLALTEVSRSKEAEVPDYQAEVSLDGEALVSATMEGRSLEVAREEVPMSALGDGALTFRKEGSGILYYGATLTYAKREPPTTPIERGLAVQRWLEPFGSEGLQGDTFAAGELVRLQIRVATPQERTDALVEIPLPAGLEVVDTSLATTAATPAPEEEGDEIPWAHRFFQPFNHIERRDDRIVLVADLLPAGLHTATVITRATTIGSFTFPPASASQMYGPEVYGRSEGGTVRVVEALETASR